MTIVTAKTSEHAAHLYRDGAHFVIIPSVLGGELRGDAQKKSVESKDVGEDWQAMSWDRQSDFVLDEVPF